ncbi:MAG: sigma-70 family RNA polymerase sigma factor [Gemmatimonadota bacterium]
MTPNAGAVPLGLLLRELGPQVLGAVARRHGDFADAEDAVQEALAAAATQWPARGIPDNPRGWLYQVALRRLADQARSERSRRRREEAVSFDPSLDVVRRAPEDETERLPGDGDDTLLLLFMCCHPALTPTSSVALALRAVGGLTTTEIARAFLVPEATMAQRISRAKRQIKASGVPFERPDESERGARLAAVLQVLYLMFNEGYASSGGPTLARPDLSGEAIRLTRAVHALLPGEAEVAGLLALLLLTDARRSARTGPLGELIPLDEQERGRWDASQIAEGVALVSATLPRGRVGPYQLQAAIAAVHDEAPSAESTDWAQIFALYSVLARLADNPMVELNRAIAAAMVQGPEVGLTMLDALEREGRLAGHYRLDAVRGHLYERSGDVARAVTSYQSAADRTASIPERNYLLTRAARLRASGGP